MRIMLNLSSLTDKPISSVNSFLGKGKKDIVSKENTNSNAPPESGGAQGKVRSPEAKDPPNQHDPTSSVKALGRQQTITDPASSSPSIQFTSSILDHNRLSSENDPATIDVTKTVPKAHNKIGSELVAHEAPHKSKRNNKKITSEPVDHEVPRESKGNNTESPRPASPEPSPKTHLDTKDTQLQTPNSAPSNGEPMSTSVGKSDRIMEQRLKNSDTASIRRSFNTPWPKTFAKMFRGAKSSGPSTITADIKETDTVIAIVGRSGVEGKHEFASSLTDYCPHYGDSVEVQHVVIKHPRDPDRNAILAYTTGNDEKLSDALRSISIWLAESSSDNKKLSGVIYLEPITSKTVPKMVRTALDVVDKHVEKSNIVIVTTGWGDISPDASEQREKEARARWRVLVDRGVSILKLCPPGVVRDADADTATSLDFGFTPRDVINLVLSRVDEKRSGTRSQWKGKEKRAGDIFMDDPRSTDVVIPIMGPTGVGKSTFINTVADKIVTKVGHSLNSETAQLHPVILPHPKESYRRVILLDTPGFNDTYVSESEILRRIAAWLAQSYSANMKLAGVIYFHEISQTRMLGTSRRDLDMFNKLCGAEAMKNVILATTKWGDVLERVGAQREQELKETHWRDMMELGSDVKRFEATFESGWKILNRILEDDSSSGHVDAVEIQNELVEIKKILPDTEAGRTLLYSLEEMLEIQRYQGEQLRGDDSNSDLKERIRENNEKVHAMMKQIRELSGPLHYRVLGWMKKLKSRVEKNTTNKDL